MEEEEGLPDGVRQIVIPKQIGGGLFAVASFYAWGRDRSLFLSRFSRADATWTSWSASECTGRIRTRPDEIKLQKWEGQRKRERERRVWERERESRVGILSVGRRSPPQLSFDLCRSPELPPPRTHAPQLFYPLGERFKESKVLLTVHTLVLVVIVGKGMTPVRLFFRFRSPPRSTLPPSYGTRKCTEEPYGCDEPLRSFFRFLFIKRIHCLVRERILSVFESLDQNCILCSNDEYNVQRLWDKAPLSNWNLSTNWALWSVFRKIRTS